MANIVSVVSVLIFLAITVSSQNNNILFRGFYDVGTNLSLSGVAEIQKDGILKLTNDTSRLLGHAIYPSPIKLKNSITGIAFSFSTSFSFSIAPEYPKLGGHGLAFTVSPSKYLQALPSQYLGLLNASDNGNFSNHLFAVEFDTVQDFEFEDINDNHVGIDINGLKSNKSASASYYDEDEHKIDLNLKGGKPIQAWIDYDSGQKVLNVTISPFSKKPKLPLMSFHVDLSPIFHEFMYVGFSASTGLLASSHYIFGWSFAVNSQPQPLNFDSLPSLPSPTQSKKEHTALVIGISVSVVVFLLSAIAVAIYVFLKVKNADPIEEDWELHLGPHRYSYQELKKATKGFRDTELLGFGGFGKVYKGNLLNSKTQFAVKRISHDSTQGIQEFASEITTIGRLRHRNLTRLLGWCRRKADLLIVYEYMANGSLDQFLFNKPKAILNWVQRFKIIKDVASALVYLHEGYEKVVIHRDVKASNVLLDSELNAKLGDFGLARLHEHGSNLNTTTVVGTFGYLAPELSRTGKATTRSDVYAFGALLLEVVCGRRPIEPKAKSEELVLVDWVWDMYREGKLLEVVDFRFDGQFDEEEIVLVLKLGLMCTYNLPSARPNMRQVVRYLDAEVSVPEDLKASSCGIDEERILVDDFNDFEHSFASSSIDNMSSSHFFAGNKEVDDSMFASPLYLDHARHETR